MIILLPPSETKEYGTNVHKVNLSKLSFPALKLIRSQTIESLIKLSSTPKRAIAVLGISQKQIHEVETNQELLSAKTSPAISIYSGVLFDAFDYKSLSKAAKNRADKTLWITSALFGLLKPQDAISHYRLSGDAVLPKIGSVAKLWIAPTDTVIRIEDPQLVVDMRSGVYAKFWQPQAELIDKTVVIKIMTKFGKGKSAKKIAISHSNKLTKGLLARDLVTLSKSPKSAQELLKSLQTLKWNCELEKSANKPYLLEVFI